VLILRAEQGRDWLQARFEQAGAQVTRLAVYARVARTWSDNDALWIAQRVTGVPPVLVVTSSEAVDSLCAAAAAADASGATLRWLQLGRVLALHPRIVARLHAAGFADAACVPCEVEALLGAA
jgi:uroporphyrinogen-III synthase